MQVRLLWGGGSVLTLHFRANPAFWAGPATTHGAAAALPGDAALRRYPQRV